MKNSSVTNRISRVGDAGAAAREELQEPANAWLENTVGSVEEYARREPWNFGLWMLGIGFVLGWKLKMW
jgi:hypothetical protein